MRNYYPLYLILLAVALFLATFLYWSLPADARGVCGLRTKLTAALTNKHKETRQGGGLVNPRRAVEIFAAADGSWTLITTDLNGVSCIIMAGQSWETTPTTYEPPEH